MPDSDACRAWQLLVRFFFAQREHLPPSGPAGDLSPVQCHVLHLLEPDRPWPMGRLASTLSCDASNVTGLVDRLEARGLVRRRPSPADRRVKELELTPEGTRVRASVLKRISGAPLPIGRLRVREQRALIRILERLLHEASA